MSKTISTQDSHRLYLARRIIRASDNPAGRTYRKLVAQADRRTLRMVEVFPLYGSRWCVAKAEALTVEHLDSGE